MVIGLLGGIGAGKSAVAALFAEMGAQVVDADRLAHQVLLEDEARSRIVARFGREVLGPDGQVDRRALGDRVFGDPALLRELNAIVHPQVEEWIRERVRAHRASPDAGGRLLVLDVPLLAESSLLSQCDALVFVEADLAARQARVRERGWSAGEIERRESLQAGLAEKRLLADFTVENSGPLEATRGQVGRLIEELRGPRVRGRRPGPKNEEKGR